MEVERYKMILTTKVNKELKDKITKFYIGQKLKKEIYSDNIRILGHDFVKNNKNKAKLIINNKKYGLKDLVNYKEFTNDKIKINMILSKDISNISHMFKNCVKLLEISIDDDFINLKNIWIIIMIIMKIFMKIFMKIIVIITMIIFIMIMIIFFRIILKLKKEKIWI